MDKSMHVKTTCSANMCELFYKCILSVYRYASMLNNCACKSVDMQLRTFRCVLHWSEALRGERATAPWGAWDAGFAICLLIIINARWHWSMRLCHIPRIGSKKHRDCFLKSSVYWKVGSNGEREGSVAEINIPNNSDSLPKHTKTILASQSVISSAAKGEIPRFASEKFCASLRPGGALGATGTGGRGIGRLIRAQSIGIWAAHGSSKPGGESKTWYASVHRLTHGDDQNFINKKVMPMQQNLLA